MLKESFIFLQGVQRISERRIWQQGINNWESYLNNKVIGISAKRKSFHRTQITQLKKAITDKDEEFFAKKFPKKESWRLYNLFKEEALYLDIETTHRGDITVIGTYDGENQHFLVKGKNLDKYNIERILQRKKLLITFNGKSFDIPIIQHYFGMKIQKPHIDLMHVLKKIGYEGGLKAIEKKLGIKRPEEVVEADGSDAVLLWNSYLLTGDDSFLMKLLMYNEQDCVNLKTLAEFAIPRLWEKTRCTN